MLLLLVLDLPGSALAGKPFVSLLPLLNTGIPIFMTPQFVIIVLSYQLLLNPNALITPEAAMLSFPGLLLCGGRCWNASSCAFRFS